MRELLTDAAIFVVIFVAFLSAAFCGTLFVAGSSETEVMRDAKGRPVRIFVCNTNNYTTSCNDNSGQVHIDEVPDAG
jgi:hypothetical protein